MSGDEDGDDISSDDDSFRLNMTYSKSRGPLGLDSGFGPFGPA